MIQQDGQSDMVEPIETSRLLLRRPTQGDAGILSNLWRNGQVQQFMGGVLSQQDAEARMVGILHQWEESQVGLWAVCEREKDEPIGLCGFGMFESETEVIYKLFPAFWGRGYATEATAGCLAYGFQALMFDHVIGVTQEANQRSQRVLEKLGMHHVRSLWKWEAAQRVYELNRTEWLTAQGRLETMSEAVRQRLCAGTLVADRKSNAIDPAFSAVLHKIYNELKGSDVNWVVTGSLSFVLQGLPVTPHDIDIQTDEAGSYEIERRFAVYVTRKVMFSSSERIRSHFGRLLIDGITVELMGNIQKRLEDGSWENPVELNRHKLIVVFEGMHIPVLSLEYEAPAYRKLGRLERAQMLQEASQYQHAVYHAFLKGR